MSDKYDHLHKKQIKEENTCNVCGCKLTAGIKNRCIECEELVNYSPL